MKVYYNEIDDYCIEVLRQFMKSGFILKGDIDERSIEDVAPSDLKGYDQCHFFAGIGVWAHVTRNYGELWTGSCPCQPFSQAGKRKGFADKRHLWPAFHWLIEQCRPRLILGEQVGSKATLPWIDLVFDDLVGTGYAVWAKNFPAASVGAPHIRQRIYWCGVSNTHIEGWDSRQRNNPPLGYGETSPTNCWSDVEWLDFKDGKKRPTKPGLCPLADGFTGRNAVLHALGNTIVAPQAQIFAETVMENFGG